MHRCRNITVNPNACPCPLSPAPLFPAPSLPPPPHTHNPYGPHIDILVSIAVVNPTAWPLLTHTPSPSPPIPQVYGPHIDILVSNAAVNPTAGPLLTTPLDAMDKILDINVKAALALVQVGGFCWLGGGAKGGGEGGRGEGSWIGGDGEGK